MGIAGNMSNILQGRASGGGGGGGVPFGDWVAVGWPFQDGTVVFQPVDHQFKLFHNDAAGNDITATLVASVGKLLVFTDSGGARVALRIAGVEEGAQVGAYGTITEETAVWTDGATYTATIEP